MASPWSPVCSTGCISLGCKMFTSIKYFLFHTSPWEFLLTALRGRKGCLSQGCSEKHSGGRKRDTKSSSAVDTFTSLSFLPRPPPTTPRLPSALCPGSSWVGHLFPYTLLPVSVPQHVLITVRTSPFLAQPGEALHGLLVFENSFLQGPRIPALESPEANSFDLQ